MSYLKNILFSLKEVIITYILSYIVVISFSAIYTLLGGTNLDDFIATTLNYILLIYYVILIIYFYPKDELTTKPVFNIFPLIALGISFSCFFNMIIFFFSSPSLTRTIPLTLSIISSGIIGPIYEEVIFRHIFLKKLKKFNSPHKAIIINTIIFALIHGSLIKIIYALILGLLLNLIYEKYQKLTAPILIHISANITSIFLLDYNPYILVFSLLNLIIYGYSLKKTKLE